MKERQQRSKLEKETSTNNNNLQSTFGTFTIERTEFEKKIQSLTDENSRLNTLLQASGSGMLAVKEKGSG